MKHIFNRFKKPSSENISPNIISPNNDFPNLSSKEKALIAKHAVKAIASGEITFCEGSPKDSYETKIRNAKHCCREGPAVVCGGNKSKSTKTIRKIIKRKRTIGKNRKKNDNKKNDKKK